MPAQEATGYVVGDDLAFTIESAYSQAETALVQLLEEAISSGRLADAGYYRELLGQVGRVVQVTGDYTLPLAVQATSLAYTGGLVHARRQIVNLGIPPREDVTEQQLERQEVERLTTTKMKLLHAGWEDRFGSLVEQEHRNAVRAKVLHGKTAPAARTLEQAFQQAGITFERGQGGRVQRLVKVKCKDGVIRNYDAAKYAVTVVRTTAKETESKAITMSGQRSGLYKAKWDKHVPTDLLCSQWEGVLQDTRSPSFVAPPGHPRCWHTLLIVG